MEGDWSSKILADCGTWFSGGTPKKSNPNFWSGNIPWISAKSLHDFFVCDSEDRVTEAAIGNGTRLLPVNSIIFVVRGMSLKSEFRLGITTRQVAFNQDLKAIVPNDDIDANFLAYAIKAQTHLIMSLVEEAGHGTGVLPTELIKSLTLHIPSRETQESIGGFFRSIDDKIELNRKMNATLESMAQAMFKSWFVDFDPVIDNALAAGNPIPEPLQPKAQTRQQLGDQKKSLPPHIQKLFPNQFQFNDELGWIPQGWDVSNFGSLLSSTIGGDWGKETRDEKHDLEVVIIRGADINEIKRLSRGKAPSRWVESRKYKTRSLEDGDLVIEVSGGSANQPTGRSVFVTENMIQFLGGRVVPASFCRRFRPIGTNEGFYAALYLNHIYLIGKMWQYQIQSTGISNFQTSTFLKVEQLVIPGSDVLKSFYRTVRPIIDRVTVHGSNELAKLRDTLLPKLLSGELRIPDAEKLVADQV